MVETDSRSIPKASVRRVVEEIYDKVSRNRLQQALSESRILPKQDDRAMIKQVCSDPQSWTGFMDRTVGDSVTSEQGFRLLGTLTESYVRSAPPVARSAFEEARRAAERSDSKKFFAELEKISLSIKAERMLSSEDWAAFVWLRTPSEKARGRIAHLARWSVAHDGTSVPPVQIQALEPPEQVLESTSGVATSTSSTPSQELIAYLESQVAEPPAPDWHLAEQHATTSLPAAQIKLPDPAQLESAIGSLRERLLRLIELAKWQANLALLPHAVEALRAVADAGNAATDLVAKVEAAKALCSERIEAALADIGPEFTPEAEEIRTLADKPEHWPAYLNRAQELVGRNHEAVQNRTRRVFQISKEIEQIAAAFDPARQRDIGRSVSKAIEQGDVGALEKLKSTFGEERLELDKERAGRVALASRMLEAIRENLARLTEDFAAACLELCRENKAQLGYNLISAYFAAASKASALAAALSPAAAAGSTLVPGAPPESAETLKEGITKFSPRDRSVEKEAKPVGWREWGPRLYTGALHALSGDSTVGLIDNALDLLLLSKEIGDRGRDFAYAGLTLLTLPRPESGSAPGWGQRIVEGCPRFERATSEDTLRSQCMTLLSRPEFDEFVGERLLYSEVLFFADILTGSLISAPEKRGNDALEDIAFAIGSAARFGDLRIVRALLLSLVKQTGATAGVVEQFEKALEYVMLAPPKLNFAIPALSWVAGAMRAFHAVLRVKKPTRGDSGLPNVSIPQSVKSAGGYSYTQGQSVLEITLLVANPSREGFSIVEVAISGKQNGWMLNAICHHIGPLAPDDKVLVRIRLDLLGEVRTPATLQLEYRTAFKDASRGGSTRYDTRSVELPIREPLPIQVDDYPGADSRPMILQGKLLDRSPSSVRKALDALTGGLYKDGAAGLLYGRRRRGKTSILRTLEHNPDLQRRYCIVFDTVEHRPFETFWAAVRHFGDVLDEVSTRLNVGVPSVKERLLPNCEPWEEIQTWVGQVRDKLTAQTRVLLLLDEFQKWLSRLADHDRGNLLGLFRGLRNVPSADKLSFSLILSGLTNLKDYANASNDFRNAFDYYQLKELTIEESEALVRANSTIEFDRRAISRVRALSGQNPFLLNLLCQDVVELLRDANRNYCLLEDVEAVVARQLERGEDSKVWRYLEYLLRKDEEDHGPQISEYPALVGLANALRNRSSLRTHVSISEIASDMESQGVECDRTALEGYLGTAARSELVEQSGRRYAIKTGWLCEWLGESERLLPVLKSGRDDLVLNRYRIGRLLKTGGQAEVYEAVDTVKTDARVILKIYRADSNETRSRWFEREAKALYALNHPAVVMLIDHDVDTRRGDVLVLKPVPGRSLRELLEARPADAAALLGIGGNLKTQVEFLQEIAEALSSCHEAGVVHKDLSPSNIMVREDYGRWRPVLIDFGLASHPGEEQPGLTSMKHTPGYLPPEKYDGQPRRAPADIYCLGLVAYEIITGSVAFPQSPEEAIAAQRSYDFRAVAEARPDAPSRLAELVESMLHVNPGDRPDAITAARSFGAALEPDDWRDYITVGMEKFANDSFGAAFDSLTKAVLAPDADVRSKEFVDGLEVLSSVSISTGKLASIAPALIRRFCQSAAASGAGFPTTTATRLFSDLATASSDQKSRIAIGLALETLCDAVESGGPLLALCDSLELLMGSSRRPAFWDRREDLYLMLDGYMLARLLDAPRLGYWCVQCCRTVQSSTADYTECQLWLQRAARCGAHGTEEYEQEFSKVQPILASIGAKSLPEASTTQESPSFFSAAAEQEEPSKILGSGEQGHFNVERMEKWVSRLQRLYPWVVGARRVRGEGSIARYPTRILDLHELNRHSKGLPESMAERIIPAVLDASYSAGSKDRAIRINIVLPGGTTVAQRDAAIRKLRENKRIFPEEM